MCNICQHYADSHHLAIYLKRKDDYSSKTNRRYHSIKQKQAAYSWRGPSLTQKKQIILLFFCSTHSFRRFLLSELVARLSKLVVKC